MLRFITIRLAQLPLLLWVIYTGTFMLAWVVPGNPLQRGDRVPEQRIVEAMLARYSLDDPVKCYVQYLIGKRDEDGVRRGGVIRGDLGPSMSYTDWTVNQIIGSSLPVSVELGLGAIVIALIVGVVVGVIGGVFDGVSLGIVLVGISLPTFVTGSALLAIFCLNLRWVPIGWGGLSQMILPMITLSLPFAAYIARLTRLGMIDVMTSDFIRTARAKGLAPGKVVFKHGLKVAFLPVLSFLGPAAAGAMTGSFVVEQVFNIPGMGQHFVAAVQNKDLFLSMGVVLVYAVLLIVFNLLVDVAYTLVDPRIEL
ncbi:MAG: ABC transporter permease subunit [Planctomycetes bacterium]|nr:ABC transporter permease subunit [Planctomycetota bacterium]